VEGTNNGRNEKRKKYKGRIWEVATRKYCIKSCTFSGTFAHYYEMILKQEI